MPDDRPRPFSWSECCPWLLLGRTLQPALSVRVLLLSVIGWVGTKAGWRLFGQMFEATENPALAARIASARPWPWEALPESGTDIVQHAGVPNWLQFLLHGPLVRAWYDLTHPFRVFFDPHVGWTGVAYAILCGLWALAVWSFFGGLITRTAAMRLTRDEVPALGHCLRFTNQRYVSYFTAPLFPLLGIVLAAIPLILLGLLARLDVGSLLAGLLGFLILLCGLFMAVLYVALAFGWPLMWATISTEGSDAFDALSRMYAYVYQRPFHLLFYGIVAAIVGAIGFLFVWLLGGAVIALGRWGLALGSGPDRLALLLQLSGPLPETAGGTATAGSNLLQFWFGIVWTAIAAFPIGYLWSAFCGIYLLLRKDVDAAETDEVFLTEEQEAFGLPQLVTDPQGVPLAENQADRRESPPESGGNGTSRQETSSDQGPDAEPPGENDTPRDLR